MKQKHYGQVHIDVYAFDKTRGMWVKVHCNVADEHTCCLGLWEVSSIEALQFFDQ